MKQMSIVLAAACAVGLSACQPGPQVIDIKEARYEAPRTPGGAGVAYFSIRAAHKDRIIGMSSPSATAVEMHRSVIEGGMAKMLHESVVDLPAGSWVAFEPGGRHVMVIDPLPNAAAATFPITIQLESGHTESVNFPVGSPQVR